jgi:hypothetical protein
MINFEWLANMVVVKKVNGEWISDFNNLNNAFLKDNFPLPKVDKVDSMTSFEFSSSSYANLGYHQISMYLRYNKKDVFHDNIENFVIRSCHLSIRIQKPFLKGW